jgi:hypothetical protein
MQHRSDLARVLDDLGPTLLTIVYGQVCETTDVEGITFYDPVDESGTPYSALVLGVGVRDPADIAGLLTTLGHQGAAGLIVRAPVMLTDEIKVAVDRSGVPLVGLTRGASWTQLAAMLRSSLVENEGGSGEAESVGGVHSGDLFALANGIMAILDAPVTIEDRNSRVLAFSGRQEEADSSRIETILNRQVPERFTRSLLEAGVYYDLYRSDKPLWISPEPPDPGQLPRVAVAIRANDQVFGSIWAAVREPLGEERLQAFGDAAKLVALHMMHTHAGSSSTGRPRADLVSTVLEDRTGTYDALRRLGLADKGVIVLGLRLAGDAVESVELYARRAGERQRLSDAFAMHLTSVHPRSATALIGDVCYGLIPIANDAEIAAEESAARIAREFLARAAVADKAVIGVSPVAHRPAHLATARSITDRILRVLLSRGGQHRQVARLEDVYMESLLLELRDLVTSRGDRPSGPVARLLDYDAKHSSQLVETLRAWLDAFGDVASASAALFVHPNTFRYRLRRVVEVGRIDLDAPDARLAAILDLRVLLGP